MLGKAGDMVKDGWQNPFNFNQQSQVSGFPAPPTQMPPMPGGGHDPNAPVSPPRKQPGLQQPVGQRYLFRGDMGISEQHMGTEAFEREMRAEAARPTPPFLVANPGGQPSSPGVQGRPDNRMAIQDLFTKNNIQAPQGFLDQLIGLLGGNAPPTQMPPMPGGGHDPNAPVSPPQQQQGLQQPVGKRFLFHGDAGVSEQHIGTEAFEREMRALAARQTPPFLPQQTVSPTPVANPGTATPTPPKQYGTPYGPMTPPRVQPTPPPPQVLTDADVAAQEAEIRRLKGLDWARANPNNWFMNPYMQDNPRVREVRSRNPTVNKSGKGGGGSSNRKFTNVNGKMKWT
jgi:hypothetical protein